MPNSITLNPSVLHYDGEDANLLTVAVVREGQGSGPPRGVPMKLDLGLGPAARVGTAPLISCLMITKDRFELARLSVGCFRRQTWPRRELIVLDESRDDRLAEWIGALNDPAIRFFRITHPMPLGALRNESLALAGGSLVCQWDDDDLQHPARLEMAMAAMAATKSSASFLVRESFWFPQLRRIGILEARPRPLENTMLAERDPQLRYPELARREDTPAVEALLQRRRVVLLNLPELYIYVVHGKNTWDMEHMAGIWSRSLDRHEGDAVSARLKLLEHAYPIREYLAALAASDERYPPPRREPQNGPPRGHRPTHDRA